MSTLQFVELVFVIFATVRLPSSVPINCPVSVHMTPSSVDTQNFQLAFCRFQNYVILSAKREENQTHTLVRQDWMRRPRQRRWGTKVMNWRSERYFWLVSNTCHSVDSAFFSFYFFFFFVIFHAIYTFIEWFVLLVVNRWYIQYLISTRLSRPFFFFVRHFDIYVYIYTILSRISCE